MRSSKTKTKIKNRIDVLNKQETLFKNYIDDINNEINKINLSVRVANYAESFEKINQLEESITNYNEKIKEILSEKELLDAAAKEALLESKKQNKYIYPVLIVLFMLAFVPFLINTNFTGYTTFEPASTINFEFNATLGQALYINLSELNSTGNILNFSLEKNDYNYKIEENKIIINTTEIGMQNIVVFAEANEVINIENNETQIVSYEYNFNVNIFEENLDLIKEELQSRFTQEVNIKSLRKENNLYDLYLEFTTDSGKKGYISIYGVPDLMNITDFQYTDSIQYIMKNEQ